jgi:YHS domain-containing protein
MIMNWLAQNWIWILLGLVVLVMLGRGRFHGRGGLSHHGDGGRGHGGTGYDQATHGSQPSGDYSQLPIQPGVAIDPVTRQDVSTATAVTSIYQGRIYYFTSAESRQRFEASPAQYAREGLGHALGPAQSAEPPPRRRRGGC